MKDYRELLCALEQRGEEGYRLFNERIANILAGSSVGVRMPALKAYGRALLREEDFDLDGLLSFPDDVYEVRLLKCFAVGRCKMPFGEKVGYIRRCIPVIDCWSVCDLFCASLKEVKGHREMFLPEIERCVEEGGEFQQRFAYVMLLGCYMEREYLPVIFALLAKAKTQYYYVYTGAAWLIAEALVKFFAEGAAFLRDCPLDARTVNKAIQKARESYRLGEGQKNYLKSLKK